MRRSAHHSKKKYLYWKSCSANHIISLFKSFCVVLYLQSRVSPLSLPNCAVLSDLLTSASRSKCLLIICCFALVLAPSVSLKVLSPILPFRTVSQFLSAKGFPVFWAPIFNLRKTLLLQSRRITEYFLICSSPQWSLCFLYRSFAPFLILWKTLRGADWKVPCKNAAL